jgi:hypothetical protein
VKGRTPNAQVRYSPRQNIRLSLMGAITGCSLRNSLAGDAGCNPDSRPLKTSGCSDSTVKFQHAWRSHRSLTSVVRAELNIMVVHRVPRQEFGTGHPQPSGFRHHPSPASG